MDPLSTSHAEQPDPSQLKNMMIKNGIGRDSPFLKVPREMMNLIISHLDIHDAKSLKKICKALNKITEDPLVMRIIAFNSGIPVKAADSIEKIKDLINLFNKTSIHSFYECSPKNFSITIKDVKKVRAEIEGEIKKLLRKHGDDNSSLQAFFKTKLDSLPILNLNDRELRQQLLLAAMQDMPDKTYLKYGKLSENMADVYIKETGKKGESEVNQEKVRPQQEPKLPGFKKISLLWD